MDATAVQVIETIAVVSESAKKNWQDLFDFLIFFAEMIALQSKTAKKTQLLGLLRSVVEVAADWFRGCFYSHWQETFAILGVSG